MSLLTIIQNVCDDIGLDRPNSVIGNSSAQVRQLLMLLQREGRDLAKRTSWRALRKRNTFNLVASASQGAIDGTVVSAGDFDYIINGTFNNLTLDQPVKGPIEPVEIEQYQTIQVAGPYQLWYQLGTDMYIYPTPSATDQCQFLYASKNWCQSSGGTGQTKFAADGDTALLDESLLELGLIWRWLRRKGMDYTQEFDTYETRVADAIAREGGRETLCMDREVYRGPGIVVPQGSWNLP